MGIFLGIVMALVWIAGIFCVFGLFRNDKVYKYRLKLIREIGAKCKEDLLAGRDPEWRWKAYDTVGYQEQVYKFWKPVESFYEIDPTGISTEPTKTKVEDWS